MGPLNDTAVKLPRQLLISRPPAPPGPQKRTKQQLFCGLTAAEVDHLWREGESDMQESSPKSGEI